MTEPLIQFFYSSVDPKITYDPSVQRILGDLAELAEQIGHRTPRNPERTVALRKLLEARDQIIRAYQFTTESDEVIMQAVHTEKVIDSRLTE